MSNWDDKKGTKTKKQYSNSYQLSNPPRPGNFTTETTKITLSNESELETAFNVATIGAAAIRNS